MTITPFLITNAELSDVPRMVQLLDALFSIEQDFSPEHKHQAAGLKLLIENSGHAIIKVAKTQEGIVIGMVSVQLVISTAQGSYSAWVEDMIVDTQFRAHGVGRALLNAALTWAKNKGATRAQLLVDLDNTNAIGYYDHLGWESSRMGMRRLLLKN